MGCLKMPPSSLKVEAKSLEGGYLTSDSQETLLKFLTIFGLDQQAQTITQYAIRINESN